MDCVADCEKAIQLSPNMVKSHKKKAQALAHMLKFA